MMDIQKQIQARLAAQLGEMHIQLIALQVENAELHARLAEAEKPKK